MTEPQPSDHHPYEMTAERRAILRKVGPLLCKLPWEAVLANVTELVIVERIAARAEGRRDERQRWTECALFDATMEGPKHKGWNRSALDRLLKETEPSHDVFEIGRETGRREAFEECARIADPRSPIIAAAIRGQADHKPSSPIRQASPAELRAQRRSYVAGEAALGSDADEAAYRSALDRGDKAELARLDAEAEERRWRAIKWMDENDV